MVVGHKYVTLIVPSGPTMFLVRYWFFTKTNELQLYWRRGFLWVFILFNERFQFVVFRFSDPRHAVCFERNSKVTLHDTQLERRTGEAEVGRETTRYHLLGRVSRASADSTCSLFLHPWPRVGVKSTRRGDYSEYKYLSNRVQ